MKYLVIGNGYLGNQFAEYLTNSNILVDKIVSQDFSNAVMREFEPECIINCAGKTGRPNIDWCESNKEETFFSNVVLPSFLLNSCKKYKIKMVHIGSGCTYYGNNNGKGFSEIDEPNFDKSYYSWTKIISERFLKDYDVLQIRIRMPISSHNDPRNLVSKLLGYNQVLRSRNSITYIPDMIKITQQLIEKNIHGIFNVVNDGSITHKEILDMYVKFSGENLNYKEITPEDLNKITIAKRSNCILSVEKLKSIGITVRHAKEVIKECLQEYVANKQLSERNKI